MLLHFMCVIAWIISLWFYNTSIFSWKFEKSCDRVTWRNKFVVECLQANHLWRFISWGYLIVKLFIKNVLLVKNKKNTVNYASSPNQISSYWRFKKKMLKCSQYPLQLKAYYILLHLIGKVNFCTPWNTNWFRKYMTNCTLSFLSVP